MSPYMMNMDFAYVLSIKESGYLSSDIVDKTNSVAPVINLTPETAESLIGTGVIGDEYRLP